MDTEPSHKNRMILFGIVGLAIGLVIGLVVLGWWLFPVEWVDFSPEQMGPADQEEYLRMAIDSLNLNFNTAAAISRYQDLGEDGPAILAKIQDSPAPQGETAVQAFTTLVKAQPETTAPAMSSMLRTILIMLLILLLLALVGYIIYRFLFHRAAPVDARASSAEFPPELSQPEEATDIATGILDEQPGVMMTAEMQDELETPVTEIEVTEFEDEGFQIPPVMEQEIETLTEGSGVVAAAAAFAAMDADESPTTVSEADAEAIELGAEPVEIQAEAGVGDALEAGALASAAEKSISPAVPAAIPTALEYIEGIGPVYAQKLKEIGVNTPQQLLQWGSNPRGRQAIAERSEISGKLILKWVNQIDLYRIKGIGSEYAELLEQSGVDTVVELATRNPENLYQTLAAVNEARKLVRKLPVLSQVEDWITQAKNLPRIITY